MVLVGIAHPTGTVGWVEEWNPTYEFLETIRFIWLKLSHSNVFGISLLNLLCKFSRACLSSTMSIKISYFTEYKYFLLWYYIYCAKETLPTNNKSKTSYFKN